MLNGSLDGLVVVEAAVQALDVLGRHEVQEVLVEVGADDAARRGSVKPASCSCSRNGVSPGGTIVLNTTSAPLAMMSSTVSLVVGVIEREVLLADDRRRRWP